MNNKPTDDIKDVVWARNLKKEYGPQLDYFLNNGGPVEKKLAQRVMDLAGVEA